MSFCALPGEIALASASAETMPERELGTYGIRSSDVTDCVMDVNNRRREASLVFGAVNGVNEVHRQ